MLSPAFTACPAEATILRTLPGTEAVTLTAPAPAAGAAADDGGQRAAPAAVSDGGAGAGVSALLRQAGAKAARGRGGADCVVAGGDAVFRRRHTGGGLADGRAVCRLGRPARGALRRGVPAVSGAGAAGGQPAVPAREE